MTKEKCIYLLTEGDDYGEVFAFSAFSTQVNAENAKAIAKERSGKSYRYHIQKLVLDKDTINDCT
jgi:hypothetical protein